MKNKFIFPVIKPYRFITDVVTTNSTLRSYQSFETNTKLVENLEQGMVERSALLDYHNGATPAPTAAP